MKKNRKGLAIAGLLALCLILTVGAFILTQSPKGEDSAPDSNDTVLGVTPGNISGDADETGTVAVNPGGVKPADINPSAITPRDSEDKAQTNTDITLTEIEDKPEPPPNPVKTNGEMDKESYGALDPELKNPNKKPDTAPVPVEPAKPAKDNTPNAGDKDGKGNIYIPGFGWVKDEGGGGQGEKSVGEGSLDKIIGY